MSSRTIIVVGNGPYKASTAALLRRCGHTVKETTDIVVSGEGHTLVDARRWISKNSLRRLNGQYVKVICSLDAEGCYDAKWVDIMSLVFKKHSPSVAAVLQNSKIRSEYEHLKEFISDDASIVLDSMDDDNGMLKLTSLIGDMKSFRITTETISGKDLTAWSSEKVLVFGRTGAGKSTIAQMLTLGHLDPSGSSFKASSSARGVTSEIWRGEGRGWHVTDTPGFGEAKGGTVSTKEATDKIKKFVVEICGIYSHYLYVVKKDRINVYDERLWKFFTKVFADAEENFSVVVTGCAAKLLAEDIDYLKKTFEGCKNFIYVNFCPISTDDPELEEENEGDREESLLELEDGLARLGVADQECSEGLYSKENVKFMKSDLKAHVGGCERSMGAILDQIMGKVAIPAFEYLFTKPVAAVGRRLHKSTIDEHFLLLPH